MLVAEDLSKKGKVERRDSTRQRTRLTWKKKRREQTKTKVGEDAKRTKQEGTKEATDRIIFLAANCCEPPEIFGAPTFSNQFQFNPIALNST